MNGEDGGALVFVREFFVEVQRGVDIMRSWYILHARGMFVKAFSMCTVPSSQVFSS